MKPPIITASNVGAMLAIPGAWKSPYQYWCEKAGWVQPDDLSDQPHVVAGSLMESAMINKTAAFYGLKIRHNEFMRPEPTPEVIYFENSKSKLVEEFKGQSRIVDYDMRLGATPDAWIDGIDNNPKYPAIIDGSLRPYLEKHGPGLLEVKCQFYKQKWGRDNTIAPQNYIYQLLTQLIMTDRRWGVIATNDGLIPKPHCTIIEATDEGNMRIMDSIKEAAFKFSESIIAGIPPEPTAAYPEEVMRWDSNRNREGQVETSDSEAIEKILRFNELKTDLPKLRSEMQTLEAILRLDFRNCEEVLFTGEQRGKLTIYPRKLVVELWS